MALCHGTHRKLLQAPNTTQCLSVTSLFLLHPSRGILMPFLFFFYFKFSFIFRERGREGKRGRATSMCGCLSHTPHYWGPRHVPWLGIETVTLSQGWKQFTGQCLIHWATPSGSLPLFLFSLQLTCYSHLRGPQTLYSVTETFPESIFSVQSSLPLS